MTGTELTSYDAQWAAMAQKAMENEPPAGGQFMSIEGGVLKLGEQIMPGNQVAVIVLDSVRENTLYIDQFNRDNPQPPLCYAFGRDADIDMGPHISMAQYPAVFQPQANTCGECRHNMWGSAAQGRGKACQNRRKLALIPAGYYEARRGSRDFDLHLFDDITHFRKADVAFLRLPVTSVPEWAKYIATVGTAVHRPPQGVLTRIYVEPDPKTQFKVHFEMLDLVPDSMAQLIMERTAAEQAIPFRGYEPPEANAGPRQPGGSLAGLRRPGA